MKKFLLNKISIRKNEKYTAIIGITPSKGAKSPILWNQTFKKLNKKIKMHCFDVNEKNFFNLLNHLEEDKYFIGGSITVPYKELSLKFNKLNILPIARKIGAINTVFRNKKGKLYATNTDGEASVKTLINNQINLKKINTVLVLGCGGAGKAVSTFISNNLIIKRNLIIAVRDRRKNQIFANKINAKLIKWKDRSEFLKNCDLIINTTSIGFKDTKKSPIPLNMIKKIKKSATIFDIIYDPLETKLIKYAKENNLKTINGIEMNLLQAVIAFCKTNNLKNQNHIKRIMSNG